MKKERILVTSALPYANGMIHFGHMVGAFLPADCYARFERLRGADLLYICGSDEYGVAITMSAELAGRSYKEHVDIFHNINKKLLEKLNFSFDFFSRTTSSIHSETAQEFFKELYDNGFIEKREENQLYSEKEKKFLADRYVVGICPKCGFENARGDECTKCGASYEAIDLKSPRSKISNDPLILKATTHWYMRFDKFKDRLENWLATKKDWKPNVLAFSKNYTSDLKPRCITRDSSWGVPVPLKEAKGKVLYVWFDAPIGYISITKEWAKSKNQPDLWKKYWLDEETKLVHFLGKDNIPFHTVFFPAMLMGQSEKYKLVDEVPANEFLMLEGRQFSKSDGWYIDLDEFFKNYSVDQARYYLAAIAPENGDAEFSFKEFQERCNSELLGKLGNFVNRVMVFIMNNFGQKMPKVSELGMEDKKFLKNCDLLVDEACLAYSSFQLRKASQIMMQLSTLGNTYFDFNKPWAMLKDAALRQQLQNVLAMCVECIKKIALISAPIIPHTAQKIWNLLGYGTDIFKENWDEVKTREVSCDQRFLQPVHLFRKIEDEEIEKELDKLKSSKKEPEGISIEDFKKIDLRVAKILSAEKIEASKRLLKLKVDLGNEKREIVSGVAEKFKPEELVGKTVIVVANLKPVKLMGVESRGMLLAAEDDGHFALLTAEGVKAGGKIS